MSNAQYFHHLYNLLHREKPFYGSGLEESLERIPEEHLYKPVGHRTIAQLLEHMLVWRDDLARRLNGEERQKIEFNGPLDWPPAADCKRTKAEYVAAFAAITTRIKAGIAGFDYAKIDDLLHPDYDYTHVDLLEGSAHHDIYHLGQINLLAALLREEKV